MSAIGADARAFAAAAHKELRTLRRYPTLFLSFFFWPILLPAVYVAMGAAYAGDDPRAVETFSGLTGTDSVAGWVFVGWAMYMWLSNVLWGAGTSLRTEQLRGTLEAVFLTPANRLVLLFGPSTGAMMPQLVNFVVMALAAHFIFGVELAPDRVARSLLVIAVTVPAMYGIGSLFASAILRFGDVSGIVQLVRGTFTIACGVTFPVVLLPEWARLVAYTLPPTYFLAGVRSALLAGADLGDLLPDLGLLALLGVATCALAVVGFRLTERSARRTGMLGRY
ncbi:MAG TPA: ABC transporter permease [Candidatus Limnocylindrales bacterium]|nr:ABC transporter permease [Candidatus Limnocylindrales bacterium]